MRADADLMSTADSAQLMSLDWVSLGSLVRMHTLDAVAAHFSELSDTNGQRGAEVRSVEIIDRSE